MHLFLLLYFRKCSGNDFCDAATIMPAKMLKIRRYIASYFITVPVIFFEELVALGAYPFLQVGRLEAFPAMNAAVRRACLLFGFLFFHEATVDAAVPYYLHPAVIFHSISPFRNIFLHLLHCQSLRSWIWLSMPIQQVSVGNLFIAPQLHSIQCAILFPLLLCVLLPA